MTRKQNIITSFLLVTAIAVGQQVRPTRNLIVMIPDGTSLSVLSASRWLKTYRNEGTHLNVDPYLCGTVTTFSSNAPIGDSAPTTSCYLTGVPQQAGNVAIYPVVDKKNDLVPLRSDSTYQPLASLPEAMKRKQKKAVGLVVTCEFPHATPADCAAHTYNRSDYKTIASQMAGNDLDVMFGGGNAFLYDNVKQQLRSNGTTLIQNDKEALMNFGGKKVWALFGDKEMPNDLDRDTLTMPSLAQMTGKALTVLEKNKEGFFLMVEGSKVDWAAHANDPIGIMSEFLAFDKAVGVALDYARKQGNTTVVILPDHGNSGFSIGRENMKKSYTSMTLEDLFGTVSNYRHTADGMETILLKTVPDSMKSTFKENTGIDLTDEELRLLLASKDYKADNYMDVTHGENMKHHITNIMNSRTNFGFTTGGHTGEEVFLAVYHPKGDHPVGNVRNTDLHSYLYKVSGLKSSLKSLTSEIYSKHTDVFAGMNFSVQTPKGASPKLVVVIKGNTLEIPANQSVGTLNGRAFNLGSVAVYIDKTNTFYLPKDIVRRIEK